MMKEGKEDERESIQSWSMNQKQSTVSLISNKTIHGKIYFHNIFNTQPITTKGQDEQDPQTTLMFLMHIMFNYYRRRTFQDA
jgi:hypothetical protein